MAGTAGILGGTLLAALLPCRVEYLQKRGVIEGMLREGVFSDLCDKGASLACWIVGLRSE